MRDKKKSLKSMNDADDFEGHKIALIQISNILDDDYSDPTNDADFEFHKFTWKIIIPSYPNIPKPALLSFEPTGRSGLILRCSELTNPSRQRIPSGPTSLTSRKTCMCLSNARIYVWFRDYDKSHEGIEWYKVVPQVVSVQLVYKSNNYGL